MHKRDPSLLHEMVRQASNAGASLAKIQLGWPSDDPLRFSDDMAEGFMAACDQYAIEGFASVWSLDGLSVAQAVGMSRYKIAHQIALDEAQTPLVANIIATGRVVYVSGELMKAPNVYPIYVEPGKYPNYRPHLPMQFGEWYGYSSHAHGLGDKLLACSRGAQYIEAHMCLSKSDLWVRDTTFALTPDEFKDMVAHGNEIAQALGHRPA